MAKDDPLLHYYAKELAYLRQAGSAFAKRYPKIAARLELDETTCPDPHVERLIEAFAFLTARIQYNIDSEFPLFTTALLENIYPHYLQPVPSMTIAQFLPDVEQELFTGGYVIEKHTPLITRAATGQICRFRTCYPVTLWPLEVTQASLEPPQKYEVLDHMPEIIGVLRLRFEANGPMSLPEMELDKLRLHLHGQLLEVIPFYELLGLHLHKIAVLMPNETLQLLPRDSLQEVGFEDEVLPYPSHAQPAYRLLQEYFCFPEKFLFYDINGFEKLNFTENQRFFDLLFLLNQRPAPGLRIDSSIFRLGCTPAINLFNTLSEPIRIHHRATEYRLAVDTKNERTTEIHSIRKVTASSDIYNTTQNVQPYFSYRHTDNNTQPEAFWYAKRTPTVRPSQSGTDTYIYFMDINFNPKIPAHQTLFAHVVCTNRHLAAQVPAGGELKMERAAPLKMIVSILQPTEQIDSLLGGRTIWSLISHLNLNYLSMTSDKEGLNALQEILRLYNFRNHKAFEHQISGLYQMHSKKSVQRLGEDAWRGFVRGYEIELELDQKLFVGGSALLFASILERFFALYTSTNSFTQLTVKLRSKDEIWKTWPPRAGKKILL